MKKIIILVSLLMMLCTVSYASVDVPETVKIKLENDEIIELQLDEYLYGVVKKEMGTSYKTNGERKDINIEAYKAQAVASRSYAVYNILNSKYDGYDMTSTTKDQVYEQCEVSDIIKEAVDSTSGQVITYDGDVINAYFFSTSGGQTETPDNVWSSKLPYLESVEDPYEPYIEGRSEWEARISASKYGEIRILERNENGRVQSLQVGSKVLTKNNIRMELGTLLIKSTWFDIEFDANTNEYVFMGRGFGHGVGMSQHGAIGMAEAGFTYDNILNWYYQNIEIEPEIYITEKENNEIEEENNEIKEVEKNYNNSGATIIEINDKTRGPLLIKFLSIISSVKIWG